MTIQAYQERVNAWIQQIGVRYFSEMTNIALLIEEVGELARLLARTHGEQSWKTGEEPEDIHSAIADEMSDVIFVVTCLANQMGIDLQPALERNLKKKSTRDKERHQGNTKLKDR